MGSIKISVLFEIKGKNSCCKPAAMAQIYIPTIQTITWNTSDYICCLNIVSSNFLVKKATKNFDNAIVKPWMSDDETACLYFCLCLTHVSHHLFITYQNRYHTAWQQLYWTHLAKHNKQWTCKITEDTDSRKDKRSGKQIIDKWWQKSKISWKCECEAIRETENIRKNRWMMGQKGREMAEHERWRKGQRGDGYDSNMREGGRQMNSEKRTWKQGCRGKIGQETSESNGGVGGGGAGGWEVRGKKIRLVLGSQCCAFPA